MEFEVKMYHVALSRGDADAKALAHFIFREVIENAHVKYNISQEDMRDMCKEAVNRAALYLSLSDKEREAFKIEAINCDNWDNAEITEDIRARKELYTEISEQI